MKTETKVQHTPTPWTVMEGKTLLHIETANMNDGKPCGMPVCSIPKARPEDAAFIVRAVNCHQELLQSVKEMREYVEEAYETKGPTLFNILSRAKEAIAKAEGK